MRNLTAGELKKALQNVPDDTTVILASDCGIEQSDIGEIIVEWAQRVTYPGYDRFWIYCNICEYEEEDEDT